MARPRHTRVPSAIVRDRAYGYGDSEFEHTLSPSSIYTHILLRHIHVITMSYIKCGCVLMWYYVFAIKIKYYEKRKVRHIAIPLRCSHDHCICFINIIQYFQNTPFYHILYRIKKRDLKKFFVSSLITYPTCVFVVLILFSICIVDFKKWTVGPYIRIKRTTH